MISRGVFDRVAALQRRAPRLQLSGRTCDNRQGMGRFIFAHSDSRQALAMASDDHLRETRQECNWQSLADGISKGYDHSEWLLRNTRSAREALLQFRRELRVLGQVHEVRVRPRGGAPEQNGEAPQPDGHAVSSRTPSPAALNGLRKHEDIDSGGLMFRWVLR